MNNFNDTDRILIVGGKGFIGKHLVNRCLKDTPHVTSLGVTEGTYCKGDSQNKVIQADLCNHNELQNLLKGNAFNYVFNLGGYIDHTPYFKGGRNNINSHFVGLLNLIDAIDIKSLKSFVQIGSSDEYGNLPAPQKETLREKPISPYSLAKTAASHFIQMLSRTEDFPGVVLRFFLVYGPGQNDRRFIPQIIKGCLDDEDFKTSEGWQLRDFSYVGDVANAMVRAALIPKAKGHIINIASGNPISIREIVEKIVKIVGGGRPVRGYHPFRKNENMELYADIGLAKDLLSWTPQVDLESGLKYTIEYYKNV